jgi:predicted GIY-YIG superfamily endonuclease
LNAIYKKWVQPLNSDNYKSEAFNKNNSTCSKIYIINNGKNVFYINGKTKKIIHRIYSKCTEKNNKRITVFYLPVPKILSDSIRKACLKNKKIELVNEMSKADLSLYCTNYSEKSNLISDALDIGKNLTDNIIDYDYTDKLSFVGINETIGVRRNKPGHSFS